ncbi:uncharacterized protein LOC118599911 [Oryzias melastigma]|uniref:uncharacterized protein LOC118599911 n=1 Tax=Oryzias melastigma TaxID=30732 RepID=UPI00168CB31F|nr:uncharacterized protein LOC118599911 [Oryzias melastigma]
MLGRQADALSQMAVAQQDLFRRLDGMTQTLHELSNRFSQASSATAYVPANPSPSTSGSPSAPENVRLQPKPFFGDMEACGGFLLQCQLICQQAPRPTTELDLEVPSVQHHLQRCQRIWTQTKATLLRTKEGNCQIANRRRVVGPDYQPASELAAEAFPGPVIPNGSRDVPRGNYLTVEGMKDVQSDPSPRFTSSTVMLTGLPQGNLTHRDVAQLVWPFLPQQTLRCLFYNVTVLPLQRRLTISTSMETKASF